MNKTARSELHRTFLIDGLPPPLTARGRHLQIFDTYIAETRIRLRKIRDPYENMWTHILQQRYSPSDGVETKFVEMYLNESEFKLFAGFEGREVRKNRYFHEFDLAVYAFDIFLGPLDGLAMAKVELDTREALDALQVPAFSRIELTNLPFFTGESLAGKDFMDVENELDRIARLRSGQAGN